MLNAVFIPSLLAAGVDMKYFEEIRVGDVEVTRARTITEGTGISTEMLSR